MTLLNALLNSYNYADKLGLVDNHSNTENVLLPIYHNSMRSNGKNIIIAQLRKDGTLLKAEYLNDGDIIMFPITEDSVARSGKNPPSHPLVDKIDYIQTSNSASNEIYLEAFYSWKNFENSEEVNRFLDIISKFTSKQTMLEEIVDKLYQTQSPRLDKFEVEFIEKSKDKEIKKKVDLSKVFLTFQVNEFEDLKDINVTNYNKLHEDYIKYINSLEKPNGVCNISGNKHYLSTKHRGLMGNAKLISVSNNTETYLGRFSKGSDILSIGRESSEKIHLMLKYFLDNPDSNVWIGGQQYLINWFSEDIKNGTKFDLTEESFYDEIMEDETLSTHPVTEANRTVGKSILRGLLQLDKDSKYYVLIVDKASNGRLSIKYFKELYVSELLKNIEKWQRDYRWYKFDLDTKKEYLFTPSLYNIFISAYGIEREGRLKMDATSFAKDQYQKLLTSLIEGKSIPDNYLKTLGLNIRNRQKYDKTWTQVSRVSLAILNSKRKENVSNMLDKTSIDRSYLFGRLLSIYERIEGSTYDDESVRVTNAEKFWNSYVNKPATIMTTLEKNTSTYLNKLKRNNYGLYVVLKKEKAEIISKISENYDINSREINKPLNQNFIFGYYGQNKEIFTSRKAKEDINNNEN